MNPEAPPWNILLLPTGDRISTWRVQDALMLRSTCRSLRIHPPTPKYISILLTLLTGKVHVPISFSEPFYYRAIFRRFHRACILHSHRKLVHFLPQVVKLACAEARSRARLYDCPPNGCYVNNRQQFEDWLEFKHEPNKSDLVTISGSYVLKMAEPELTEFTESEVSWQPNDIDIFIHGANEGDEHAVSESVSAFCYQIQKESFLVLHNHSRLEVTIRPDQSYVFDTFDHPDHPDHPHYHHPIPQDYEDADAMQLSVSPDEIVRGSVEYTKSDHGFHSNQIGHSYASSHLKRRNRGHVFDSTASVLNELEDNGWLDANKHLGIPKKYTIAKAISIDAFHKYAERISSSFFSNLKLPSINIIQFQGPPRSSLDIVSGFDLLPCQVWLTSDEASASGSKVNYASDRVKHCIQNRKLELSEYAFNPCYRDDIPESLFIKDDQLNDVWYGPIPKQVNRIIKYKTRGYTL